jgi:hypothetical protein
MRLALAALVALSAALSMIGPAHGDSNAYRAAVSFRAMRHEFLDPSTNRYRETVGTRATAHAWPYSQALAATIAMTTIPRRGRLYAREAKQRIRGLESYAWRDGAYRADTGTGDVYYDDNEWIGLELVRWWQLSGDRSALARAARLFGFVRQAWDGDETHRLPGRRLLDRRAGKRRPQHRDDGDRGTDGDGALRRHAKPHLSHMGEAHARLRSSFGTC